MDPTGTINDLGKQYIGVMAAPANPTQSSGGIIKVNQGSLVTGTPTMAVTLLISSLFGALLALA